MTPVPLVSLTGRYNILRNLRGGSSEGAFLAEDVQNPDGRYFVVKRFNPFTGNAQTDKLLRDLLRERIMTLTSLAAANEFILSPTEQFEDGGLLYLIREWVDGASLTFQAATRKAIAESGVEQILCGVLESLRTVHNARTYHGNLKPSNIILRRSDGEPVLTDFSMVPINVPATTPTAPPPAPLSAMIPQANLGFLPPEVASGQYFYSSDLYSLGLIIICLLTGKLPRDLPQDPQTGKILWHSLATDVDPELVQILDTAIQPRPEHRYPTATEMLEQLLAIAPDETPPTYRAVGAGGIMPALRRVTGAALALAIFVVGGFYLWNRVRPLVQNAAPVPQASVNALPTTPPVVAPVPPASSPGAGTPTSPAASVTPVTGALNQEQAVSLVRQWLTSKPQIFSAPFDRAIATQLTTGPLLEDITKPGGSIDWLSQNNARYEFRGSQVTTVQNFTQEGDRAMLDVVVSEDRTLYINNQVDAAQSGNSTSTVRYTLQQSNGSWKIADYQSVP
jgi:ARC6-like, IMS domain/Protein kinase domain